MRNGKTTLRFSTTVEVMPCDVRRSRAGTNFWESVRHLGYESNPKFARYIADRRDA
jgi:hypothetical protein